MIRLVSKNDLQVFQVFCYFTSPDCLHNVEEDDRLESASLSQLWNTAPDIDGDKPKTKNREVFDRQAVQAGIGSMSEFLSRMEEYRTIFDVDQSSLMSFKNGEGGWGYQVEHKTFYDFDEMESDRIKEIYEQIFDVENLNIVQIKCQLVGSDPVEAEDGTGT